MVLVNFRIVANPAPTDDVGELITSALEGRAAALFVVLAGVGIALARAPLALMLKRAFFLFVIGMVNMLIFDADILHYYGLYLFFGAAFIGACTRGVWLGILGVLLLSLIALIALDYELGWNWQTYEYADFWTFAGFLRHSFFNGWHPVLPWLAFLLFGIWLGRLPLAEKRVQWAMVGFGTVVSTLSALPQKLMPTEDLVALFGTSPIPPGPFYMTAGAGSAVAVIGATLLLTPLLSRLHLLAWLTAPGRQTLTLYVAHIMIGMGVMEEMGWFNGAVGSGAVFWGSLGFCALAALYARAWARVAKRGPLELLMRRLTERPKA
jgi:uncharacterized membrane protein YeiB